MTGRIVLFVFAFVVWALLSWVPDTQHLVVGVFIAAFVALMTGDLFVQRPHILPNLVRYLRFCFHYVPVFVWECLKANFDVAYRVVHPRLPIKPGIVKVKTELTSDVALTFLANSITLTPGTMTVDIDKDQGVLYIHWIDAETVDTAEATKAVAGRFEPILKKIFE